MSTIYRVVTGAVIGALFVGWISSSRTIVVNVPPVPAAAAPIAAAPVAKPAEAPKPEIKTVTRIVRVAAKPKPKVKPIVYRVIIPSCSCSV